MYYSEEEGLGLILMMNIMSNIKKVLPIKDAQEGKKKKKVSSFLNTVLGR